jgi:ABC-type amino acid transport substrate-binding protein
VSFVAVAIVAVAVAACDSAPPTVTPSPQGSGSASQQPIGSAVGPSTGAPTQPAQGSQAPSASGTSAPSGVIATTAPTVPPQDAITGELVKPGSLTICLALLGEPAAAIAGDGLPDGYNIAFANEIARRLALTPVIRQTLFSELTTQIQSHGCDVSVSSQNITAAREQVMSLIPYTQSKLGRPVVVAKGNPLAILALDDLCGHSASATTGSTSADLVTGSGEFAGAGLNAACLTDAKEPIDLHTYETELDSVQALIHGDVEAYLGNANFVLDYPDLIQYAQAALPPAKQGIAVALDHPNLKSAVDASLAAMIDDGTYLDILTHYLPNEQSVDNFSIIE